MEEEKKYTRFFYSGLQNGLNIEIFIKATYEESSELLQSTSGVKGITYDNDADEVMIFGTQGMY